MAAEQSESWLDRPRARIAEAARLAGVTRRTIERWIYTGKVRAFRIGRRLYVLREDLEAMAQPILSCAQMAPLPRPASGGVRRKHDDDTIDKFLRRGKYVGSKKKEA